MMFHEFGYAGSMGSYDIDGYVAHPPEMEGRMYLKFFRSGAIELYQCARIQPQGTVKFLNAFWFEQTVLQMLGPLLAMLDSFSIGPPYAIFISVLGTRGLRFVPLRPDDFWLVEKSEIKNESLLVPEIVLSAPLDIEGEMHKAFDMLWQGAGWAECPAYQQRSEKRKASTK
jgi:hypothetical protein